MSTYFKDCKTIKVEGQFIHLELRFKYIIVVTLVGDILQRKVKWLLGSGLAESMRFMQLWERYHSLHLQQQQQLRQGFK